MSPLRIGLLVNPCAGLGGAVGLKGSDGAQRQQAARRMGAVAAAPTRAASFLQVLFSSPGAAHIEWLAPLGDMGGDVLREADVSFEPIDIERLGDGTDSQRACAELIQLGIDLLVFVGGDGTARDVLTGLTSPGSSAQSPQQTVLGIPAGVKMHSGVFAISPRTAATLILELVDGGLVAKLPAQVRDFVAEQDQQISVHTFGELWIPQHGGYIQHTKVGGRENEPLAVQEIVAEILSRSADHQTWVLGPGSTCLAVKQALAGQGTLRGVDVWTDGRMMLDVNHLELEQLTGELRLLISFTRVQGFLLGRGNQQLTPSFLRKLCWPHDVWVLATRTKLQSLEQRPLLVDSGDDALDQFMCGLVDIISGYEDRLVYRVSRDV